jgi:hypothetical protein
MTTNQFIAICFPLLILPVAAVAAFVVLKLWSKPKPVTTSVSPNYGEEAEHVGAAERRDAEIRTTLREAEALIRKAERQLSRAGTP